jgi:hypothetical protein
MRKTIQLTSILCCLVFILQTAIGQEANNNFGAIDERLLIETRWKYAYTLHVESNTVLHKADEEYRHFLYFRYNYSYQEFLNGDFSKGWWTLNDRTLTYPFRNVEEFEIGNLNKRTLVLDFQQKNSTGNYQYHFIKVAASETPFVKPENELPDVLVEEIIPKKEKRIKKNGWLSFFKNRKNKSNKKSKYDLEKEQIYINIELVGGGYYGGIDPVLKDMIHIKSDGRLIKEFHSKYNGHITTKKNIDREELEQFAEYILKQQFFEFERSYECHSHTCQKRKTMQPKPMPLRLSVVYGDKKKHITVSIWAKDNYGMQYVDYPPALDKIIDAIQRMASRLDDVSMKN